MKFKIVVFDLEFKFFVKVYVKEREVAHVGWRGGDFEYAGETYEVRGPYHGLKDYAIFRLVEQELES